jgi:aromatic ring-opening dioxygenase catalytic subunit (LigB family)
MPHTPVFPSLAQKEGPDGPINRLFRGLREQLEAVRPDVLVVYDSDHVNTFFFDNWPTFAIGVTPKTIGPNDDNTGLPRAAVSGHEALAQHLYTGGVHAGFDFAVTQKFEVDHSIMVPLHFVTPKLDVPIVPIFINGVQPPLPGAKRCFALGEAVRAAIASWPKGLRVGVLASGSFSLDVAGPMMEPGQNSGVPAKDWSDWVVRLLGDGKIDDLLEEATSDQLARAGNVAGEILNWIAMLGMLGKRKPAFVEKHDGHGHAFAAWRWD